MIEWREVEGFPYEVSSVGEVRHKSSKQILKPRYRGKGGYPAVNLWLNDAKHTRRVHTLVAYAFLGPRPNNKVIHHKDENVRNNTKDNLEYISNARNVNLCGTAGRTTRINVKEEQFIKNEYTSGKTQKEIAAQLKISQSLVSKVLSNKRCLCRALST